MMTLFEVLSRPPKKTIQGIFVPYWQVPSFEDRKIMVKEINKWIKDNK